MGIFQRYTKKDKNGKDVLGKDGHSKREGPWFVQYPYTRDPRSAKIKYKTEKVSFSRKKAESIFRAKLDAFQEKEKLGTKLDYEITLNDLLDWGLEQEVMQAKASASDDVARTKMIREVLGDFKAVQVTPLMVDNFRIKMKRTKSDHTNKTYSGTTINKMIALVRRIYYLALDEGIVNSNPFARRGVFKEEPKGRYVPDAEFRAILVHLPDFLKPVMVTAYLTGMRRGEIIELDWSRINLFGGFLDLTPEDTKTEEPRRIYFNSTKELKDVFIQAERQRRPKQKHVFAKSDGEPVPKRYTERLFKKACEKAKVGPYRIHDLRHTFNTNMIKAGVNKVVIMKLTGHKTDKMFTRYSHLDKEQGEGAMAKLDALLAEVRNK
jgi:integrase